MTTDSVVAGPPTYEQIVAQFEAVSFGGEFDTPGSPPVIVKWQQSVRYTIAGANTDDSDQVRAHMRNIALLSGVDIAEVSPGAENYEVLFWPQSRFPQRFAGTRCFGSIEDHGKGPAQKGWAVVGTDNPAHLRAHCLLEELVQTFGPMNDSCTIRASLFCEGTYPTSLSDTDIIILRTLYHPDVRAGMDAATAMPIARRVIAELVAASPPK